MSKKNMTPEQKEALMKAKQEQRELVEKISKSFPKFSTSNLMGVKKRLLALHAAGTDMYRIRCFGKTRDIVSNGKMRQVKIMNAPAFNKFANILLANKEVATWFSQVSHDPTWEAFWKTIEQLAGKPKTLETWSAAEWMVARNRYTATVELVNQLSVKFLGKEMTEVLVHEVEVTALFNKETYYFRYVTPQQAWDECKDINSRYYAPNDPGSFCVGKGYYQEQMKSGKNHGYIVDKTVDAKTNSYANGDKFSFGFVLITSGGVADWGFGPENRWDGPEEQLAKAVFGEAKRGGLDAGKPEEPWIRMIMAHWFDMRKTSYNQWVKHIEAIVAGNPYHTDLNAPTGLQTKVDKNGKIYLEELYSGKLNRRIFLNEKGIFAQVYSHMYVAGPDGFYMKATSQRKSTTRWFLQTDDTAVSSDSIKPWQDRQGYTLLENASRGDFPWSKTLDELDSLYENNEFFRPHLASLSRADFETAYIAELKEQAIYSIRTKNIMTAEECQRQICKFNEVDGFYTGKTIYLVFQGKKVVQSGKRHTNSNWDIDGENLTLLRLLVAEYGYKWMKTASGYMLVSAAVAAKNPNRIMAESESLRIDRNCTRAASDIRYESGRYFSYGILMKGNNDAVYTVSQHPDVFNGRYVELD